MPTTFYSEEEYQRQDRRCRDLHEQVEAQQQGAARNLRRILNSHDQILEQDEIDDVVHAIRALGGNP